MTVIREIQQGARRVSDMVREMFPHIRGRMTAEEADLAVHLRGNDRLHAALQSLIRSRIAAREAMSVPADPIVCKVIMERNSELRWLSVKIGQLFRSPANQPSEHEGEQPAA